MDQLDVAETKLMNDLTTQVNYIEKHIVSEMKTLAENGSQIANTLPCSDTSPQMMRFKPAYVASSPNEVLVTAEGNFFDSSRDGYRPVLWLNGKRHDPVIKTTRQVSYSVAADEFPHGDGLKYMKAYLKVPFRERCALFFKCKREASFEFLLTSLPKQAGVLEFTVTKAVDGIERVQREDPQRRHRQESTDDDIPEPIANGRQVCSQATPGWTVEPESVELLVDWSEGDWLNFGNSSNVANACWNIATKHHGIGTSGKIHWHYRYWERRSAQHDEYDKKAEELGWSSSRAFTVAGGRWTAVWRQFDGKAFDVVGSAFSNPYLQVQTAGSTVSFITVP